MQRQAIFKAREVKVAHVGVGGDNPIRIQSMTTSSTRDVEATVREIMTLADHGCEIARVTVQGMKEADSCEAIKNTLVQKGYLIPLVADIHFYPPAAMRVVEFVDKVRINPGNFVDKRASFQLLEYDDNSYLEEIKKIEEGFSPLVERCIKLKKALRIGTNHGSLSDRIMSRYGDTPQGMVESAFEFTRVCRKLNFHDIIFSMKASNPLVMMAAYRLLVEEMKKLSWDYPIHLGVTEAGNGEDGRMKSAVGIGSLLLDGIGDTIRVSLTEDAWKEIDPCKRIISLANTYRERLKSQVSCPAYKLYDAPRINPSYLKQYLHPDGSVIVSVYESDILQDTFFEDLGFKVTLGQLERTSGILQGVVLKDTPTDLRALKKLSKIQEAGIFTILEANLKASISEEMALCYVKDKDPQTLASEIQEAGVVFYEPKGFKVHEAREFLDSYASSMQDKPLILSYTSNLSYEDLVIQLSMEFGALFADGIGHGIYLDADHVSLKIRRLLALNLLQSCRRRSSKTDYIACPGCGRTLFNLQEVTNKIKHQTSHLPGVKIAIMGCIVNGPGEMADADFGYVGSRTGMIDLYVGKTCVEKNIPSALACDKLIALIKSHGRWVDAPIFENQQAEEECML